MSRSTENSTLTALRAKLAQLPALRAGFPAAGQVGATFGCWIRSDADPSRRALPSNAKFANLCVTAPGETWGPLHLATTAAIDALAPDAKKRVAVNAGYVKLAPHPLMPTSTGAGLRDFPPKFQAELAWKVIDLLVNGAVRGAELMFHNSLAGVEKLTITCSQEQFSSWCDAFERAVAAPAAPAAAPASSEALVDDLTARLAEMQGQLAGLQDQLAIASVPIVYVADPMWLTLSGTMCTQPYGGAYAQPFGAACAEPAWTNLASTYDEPCRNEQAGPCSVVNCSRPHNNSASAAYRPAP